MRNPSTSKQEDFRGNTSEFFLNFARLKTSPVSVDEIFLCGFNIFFCFVVFVTLSNFFCAWLPTKGRSLQRGRWGISGHQYQWLTRRTWSGGRSTTWFIEMQRSIFFILMFLFTYFFPWISFFMNLCHRA